TVNRAARHWEGATFFPTGKPRVTSRRCRWRPSESAPSSTQGRLLIRSQSLALTSGYGTPGWRPKCRLWVLVWSSRTAGTYVLAEIHLSFRRLRRKEMHTLNRSEERRVG